MLPFLTEDPEDFALGDYVFLPGVRAALLEERDRFPAWIVKPDGSVTERTLTLGALTPDERSILADGCLINYYRNH